MAPPVFAFIATFASATIAGSVFSAAIVSAFFVAGLTLVAQGLAKKPKGFAPPLSDRKQFVRLATPPRRILYGEANFSPSIFHIETQGNASNSTTDKKLLIACAIADHAIESIDEVIVNGGRFLTKNELHTLNTSGTLSVGNVSSSAPSETRKDIQDKAFGTGGFPLTYLMKIHIDKGATGNFNDRMEAAGYEPFGGLGSWDDTGMKATGFSWIVFDLPLHARADKQHPWTAIPQIQIRAKRAYSSLTQIPNATGLSYNNPAACLYDYAKNHTGYGVQSFGEEMIDADSFLATGAICQAKGWTCNGVIDLATSPDVVFQEMRQASVNGTICDVGGKLHFRHRQTDTNSALDIDANDIVGTWKVSPFATRDARHSGISVEYSRYDQTTGLDAIETASLTNDTLRADLGDEKEQMRSAFINNREQALLAGKYVLQSQHDSYGVEIVVGTKALSLIPGDLVNLSIPNIGINHKPFWVASMTIRGVGLVDLRLIEANPFMDENVEQQNFMPALYANYTTTDEYVLGFDTGTEQGDILIDDNEGNNDKVKLVLSG